MFVVGWRLLPVAAMVLVMTAVERQREGAMQQKNQVHGHKHKAGLAVLKKLLRAAMLLLLSILLIVLAFELAVPLAERFLMHPAHIEHCLNGGGTWFYALNGCSD